MYPIVRRSNPDNAQKLMGPVSLTPPPARQAPAYRDSLVAMSQFRVYDFGSSVGVEPLEGPGETREYFKVYRLCDDTTRLTDAIWDPIRRHPSREHPRDRVDRLLQYAETLSQAPPDDLSRQLRALSARVLALGEELPGFLQEQMARLFPQLPGGSLWFVAADDVLLSRLAVMRSQLAITLTPDIPLHRDEFEGLRLLGAHSLSDGANFAEVFTLPGLAFSPAMTAFVLPTPPHALVLFFGANLELRREPEESLNDLFRPGPLNRVTRWTDPAFWEGLQQSDAESLLPWWASRLNILYSHATDPTRFADPLGRHDASAQMAWFLTLERLLADAALVLGDPNQADITRMQTTFDLLDKCENLLGYSKSGPGFKELLRRSKTMPRLNESWKTLPGHLERRFRRHTRVVFDSIYEDISEHALTHRRTRRGMLVARGEPPNIKPMSMDDYVARIVREVRNSAHGLSRQLRGNTGLLTATHDGDLPPQLTDLAKLVLFGLVADAGKLCAGEWW